MSTLTRIELRPGGCRLTRGALAPRRLRSGTDGRVQVALVATEALLLAGDHVRIEVDVRGAGLDLVEVGGTVAYDMREGSPSTSAHWDVDIRLSDGAELTWHGEPFVVATGADVQRSTTVELDAGARATLRETLVLGRSGEAGGGLRVATRAARAGEPLLVEDLDLRTSVRGGPAVLGPHRCLDSVTTLGHRLPDGPGVLQLAGEGSVRRWLGSQAHRSELQLARGTPVSV